MTKEKELNESEKQAESQSVQNLGASVVPPGTGFMAPEPTEATYQSPGEPEAPPEVKQKASKAKPEPEKGKPEPAPAPHQKEEHSA